MRSFELAIVSLLLTGGVWSVVSGIRGRIILALFFGLDLIALLLQLITEGPHWQMWPAYLGVCVFAALVILKKPRRAISNAGAGAMIGLAIVTVALSAMLPMFRLPRPTGPYPIGTRVMDLVDQSRAEAHDPGRRRELVIQIWYPAAPSRSPYAPYRRREETTLLSSYQSVLPTHSRWNAPVVTSGANSGSGRSGFPVLLFNPAWGGRRTQDTYQVEDLASHGYVVVGIDHPYNSEPVALSGGRVIHSVPVREMDFATNSLETIEAAARTELDTQTSDTLFVLNQLQQMNADPKSPFYERLDTNDVGALGHSFGGAVSAQACYDDPRIRAALDMDGSFWGEVQHTGLPKPFMFITEDVVPVTAEERLRMSNLDRVNADLNDSDDAMFHKFGGYRIVLHGSSHESFTDRAIFSPFKSFSGGGKIRPRREFSIVRQYTLAFFDQSLRGKSSPLLGSGPSPFAEAQYQFVGPRLPAPAPVVGANDR